MCSAQNNGDELYNFTKIKTHCLSRNNEFGICIILQPSLRTFLSKGKENVRNIFIKVCINISKII